VGGENYKSGLVKAGVRTYLHRARHVPPSRRDHGRVGEQFRLGGKREKENPRRTRLNSSFTSTWLRPHRYPSKALHVNERKKKNEASLIRCAYGEEYAIEKEKEKKRGLSRS